MSLLAPSSATATVAANTNSVSITALDLTTVYPGMTINFGARDRKVGDAWILATVSATGSSGGTLTTVGAVPTAYINAPFVIDTLGYLGTDASYAAATSLSLLSTLLTLFGPNTVLYTGDRKLALDKKSSTAVGRVVASIAGRTWADLDHRTISYTPTGGSATSGEAYALRAYPDGTTPVDALLVDLATGGCDVRKAAVTMASATTTDLGSAPFAKVLLTGTATITSFGTGKHLERSVTVMNDGATLAHNATSLILPGGANIVARVGDTFDVMSGSTGNWRVHNYTRADGTPLALPSAARQPSFRNRIRNGDFSVNQRGVSGTVTLAAGQYGHDGFKGGANGCTYTFARSGGLTTLTISAGNLQQPIEGDLYLTEGGTYTLSWGGTAQARINSTTNPLSASPIVANGLTADSNAVIEWGTGTLWLPQFEPGSVATPFERRDDELRRAQRYFERIGGDAGRVSVMLLGFFSSTQLNGTLSFAPKRVVPTVSISAANQWRLLGGGGAPSPATLTVVAIGLTRADIYATGSGFSANAYLLQSIDTPTNGQQPSFDFSAEL